MEIKLNVRKLIKFMNIAKNLRKRNVNFICDRIVIDEHDIINIFLNATSYDSSDKSDQSLRKRNVNFICDRIVIDEHDIINIFLNATQSNNKITRAQIDGIKSSELELFKSMIIPFNATVEQYNKDE
ncbi:hypothetical protein PFTANZ_02757 [Plasmodium falciparum Tanzania (2000708)]|uniref:Uncharacterized protein n=1 Tax=Plasmodium falciparum Tanzania (2000708) TaxID=1036725 RepID=A0A024W7J2_PLAFA|nr:hypothetical protein PFTANZ_02757 [Plasmodium falciparum Tanzania (2000708)]